MLEKIHENLQHKFLFLTKEPEIYSILGPASFYNSWFGTTITNNDFPQIPLADHLNFVSIEPILEPIDLEKRHVLEKHLDWIIVGRETGNRKNKVIPELFWIQQIVDYAKAHGIPIWLKENLRDIWPGKLIQELPEGGKD